MYTRVFFLNHSTQLISHQFWKASFCLEKIEQLQKGFLANEIYDESTDNVYLLSTRKRTTTQNTTGRVSILLDTIAFCFIL